MIRRDAEIEDREAREDARARLRTATIFDLGDPPPDDVAVQCVGCKTFYPERELTRRGPALCCPRCAPQFDARGRRQ
jgi:hypothetical protein